jgi:hypothetical protein
MAKRKRKKKSLDELGTENELMKLKMMAEFGGNFVGSDNITPDIENHFLKQVMAFHKMHENSAVTTVYKFIGEPEYNLVTDMNDKEISKELKRLNTIMSKNGVVLNVLAETPKREIYRFITEELFKHEIEEVKMKGWMNYFTYEEFHPNAEYDVKSAALDCIKFIFEKGTAFFEEHYSEDMKDGIGLSLDVEEYHQKVENFRQAFSNIKFVQCDFLKIEVLKEAGTANVVCKVSFKTQKEKGRKFKPESTTVELNLERSKYSDSWWEIKQVICELLK